MSSQNMKRGYMQMDNDIFSQNIINCYYFAYKVHCEIDERLLALG